MIYFSKLIVEKNVCIEELKLDHLPFIQKCHGDPKVQRFTNTAGKTNIQELHEWFLADYSRSNTEIISIASFERKIPFAYLTISQASKDVEVGIVLASEWRGNGLAYTSLGICCKSLFKTGVYKISARILPENTDAIKLTEKLGFQREGLLRKDIWHNGERKDCSLFSLFQNELTYSGVAL